jgi:hypothetical protein
MAAAVLKGDQLVAVVGPRRIGVSWDPARAVDPNGRAGLTDYVVTVDRFGAIRHLGGLMTIPWNRIPTLATMPVEPRLWLP